MAARRLLLTLAITPLLFAPMASAQTAVTVPQVQNSKYQFEGTTNADAVLVRAGPSDNYYPVARLDRGTTVTVVGISFDWLKIIPPEGSFSYIAKSYINKTSDTTGTVSRSAVNVRAGSSISPMKSAVQTKLPEGSTVEIIGEQDEYYKVKPPTGAFVYVHKQFITPGRLIGENPAAPANPTTQAIANPTMPGDTEGVTPLEPTTQETAAPHHHHATTTFVIQTSNAENQFAELEEKLRSTRNQPLDQQPLADLLDGYNSVVADPELPATLKRLAKTRIDYLNTRLQAQKDLQAAQTENKQLEAHNQQLQSQQAELQQKLAKEEMHVYAAVGTLQTSSVQQGGESLFRLVDPDTGRTLVYVRPSDAALSGDIGQLVGVKGQITEDPSLGLKIIAPTGEQTLNSDDLSKVTADIMPSAMNNAPATTQPQGQ